MRRERRRRAFNFLNALTDWLTAAGSFITTFDGNFFGKSLLKSLLLPSSPDIRLFSFSGGFSGDTLPILSSHFFVSLIEVFCGSIYFRFLRHFRANCFSKLRLLNTFNFPKIELVSVILSFLGFFLDNAAALFYFFL